MEGYNTIHLKYNDTASIVGCIKKLMAEYDMDLIESGENRYTFDMGGDFQRSFVVLPAGSGWSAIYDDDNEQQEEMCRGLTEILKCFGLYSGYYKKLYHYTVYECGIQKGQFMSDLDYYEYPVTDDVVSGFKGDPAVFEPAAEPVSADKIGDILKRSRENKIKPEQAYGLMLDALGITTEESTEEDYEEDNHEDEKVEGPVNPEDIFYVDFDSINIKTNNVDEVIGSVVNLVDEYGFHRVDDFNEDEEKGGLFSRIFKSGHKRNIIFYISPASGGWVTLAGEMVEYDGDEPSNWEFIDIAGGISEKLGCKAARLSADSEKWGFEFYEDGTPVCSYSIDDGLLGSDEMVLELSGLDKDGLEEMLYRELSGPEDVDSVFSSFCNALRLRNYKLNIPMDYTEEEFKSNVLSLLPDGDGFVTLKFQENE